LTAELIGWYDEHLLEHRRRLRNGCLVSVALHGLVFATLIASPPRSAPPMPEVLAIELLAALPAARVARPRPAPKAPAVPEPPPKAVAPPPPEAVAPPPPVAKLPVQPLPEETPGRLRKAQPEPQRVVPPVRAEPKPEPRRQRRQRAKALSYEDAMAALDDELGPDESADLLRPPPGPTVEPDESAATADSRVGAVVSLEMLAWTQATTRRIQSTWVTPTSFRGRGLATSLKLQLSASGQVLGTPRVFRSSGDPYFDDNAVRAVLMADPLPHPPRAGVTVFVFRSEVN
jgi:TonB family protein